jgi:CheY-like chemotaxis protein
MKPIDKAIHGMVSESPGSITVESTEGRGTTFRVSLPLAAAQMPLEPKRAAFQELELRSALPLLIVEDNLVNQKVAAAMLRSFGLQFRIANNGLEAVAMCAAGEFAAILMDCQMPEMDGLEATRQIRTSGLQVPILAVTASAADTERRVAFEAGMNDFLSKPISRTELRAMLKRWLPPVAPQNADIASTKDEAVRSY